MTPTTRIYMPAIVLLLVAVACVVVQGAALAVVALVLLVWAVALHTKEIFRRHTHG